MKCRFCQAPLEFVFIDLGNSPASNSFLTASQLNEAEVFYPLKVFVCNKCFLVQLDEFKKSESISWKPSLAVKALSSPSPSEGGEPAFGLFTSKVPPLEGLGRNMFLISGIPF